MERTPGGGGTAPGPGARGRSPVEAADLDRARRPGVPKERPPEPWPNSRPVPRRMTAEPAVPRHGRPGKTMPPVYGTSTPPRGVSGALRRAAYRLPDHFTNHWLLLLAADRVEAAGLRLRRALRLALPALAVALVARRLLRAR